MTIQEGQQLRILGKHRARYYFNIGSEPLIYGRRERVKLVVVWEAGSEFDELEGSAFHVISPRLTVPILE